MNRVTARFGRDGYRIDFVGHAGSSDACVAISSLAQALAGCAVLPDIPGSCIPDCPGAGAVMEMTVIGLLQIQKAAPDDVKVDIVCED